MPRFKVYIGDENGKPVEDSADGSFREQEEAMEEAFADMLRQAQAVDDIAEVQQLVSEFNGVLANETLTREQAAVIVTLAVSDTIRAFRDWIDELDLSATDRAQLIESGRELVTVIGADLDRVARSLVGPTRDTKSSLN